MIPIFICRNKQKGLWLPHSDIQSFMKEKVCPLPQIIGSNTQAIERTWQLRDKNRTGWENIFKWVSQWKTFICIFQSVSIFSHDTNIVAQCTRINLKDESSVIKLDSTFDLEIWCSHINLHTFWCRDFH